MAYKIAEARRAKGWSQAEFAERLGTTQQQIARWETGQRDPKADTVLKMCSVLGVTVSYLLGYGSTNEREELTDEERELITCYRAANPQGQQAIMAIARVSRGDSPVSGMKSA